MSLGQGLNVRSLAAAVLDGVTNHFAANLTAEDLPLPERRVIVAGDPAAIAADCEQLTVTMGGIGWGPAIDAAPTSAAPGSNMAIYGVRHVVLVATLWRKTPVPDDYGNPPPAEELLLRGRQFFRDAGLLSQALVEIGSRVRGIDRSAVVQAGAITPVGPSGDLVGMDGQFVVTAMELE